MGHSDISIDMCLRKKMHFTLISTCLQSACLCFYLSNLTFSIKSKNPVNSLPLSCPNTKTQKTFTSFKFMHWRCSRASLSIHQLLNKWDFRSNNKHFVFVCHSVFCLLILRRRRGWLMFYSWQILARGKQRLFIQLSEITFVKSFVKLYNRIRLSKYAPTAQHNSCGCWLNWNVDLLYRSRAQKLNKYTKQMLSSSPFKGYNCTRHVFCV